MASIREKIRMLSQRRLVSIDDIVHVTGSTRISPSFQRVTLSGDCLAAYQEVCPADGFKIDLGTPGNPAIRGFTVRSFDTASHTLHFDVHLHPHSAASTWAQTLGPRTHVRFLGFRRDFAIGDGITHHVLIGDASAIPALATILDAIPEQHHVVVLAEAPTREDLALLAARPNVATQLILGRPSIGVGSPLAEAAAALQINPAAEYWVSAEASTVRTIRQRLLQRGISRDRLHATAYWITGKTSSQRDDDEAVTYARAIEAGLDVDDPRIYDLLAFETDDPGSHQH